MQYEVEGLKIYSSMPWYPTSQNLFRSMWLGVQIIFAVQAITWATHMKVEPLIIALVLIGITWNVNKI